MISARALGVYVYLRYSEAHISAENLSKVFAEGREAMRATLSELKNYNMISSSKERIGRRIMTVNRLVEPGLWAPETRRLIQLNKLYSNLILDNNTFINKKIVSGEAREEEETMDEFYSLGSIEQDPEEIAELKRRDKERRDREYREARNAKAENKMADRIVDTPSLWSVDNSVYEFASRMVRWDIPPWESSRTPFKAAFAKSRRDFGTKGDIEIKMMDIFFGRLNHETNIKDPDMVWKLFIRDFNSLLVAAKARTVTPEDMERAKALSDKQFERF